jgi:protein SCO1
MSGRYGFPDIRINPVGSEMFLKGYLMLKNSLTFVGILLVPFFVMEYVQAGERTVNQLEYNRSIHFYRIPDVRLVDAQEREINFAAEVEREDIAIISFAFTSCTGTCPVITANLVQALPELRKAGDRYRIFLVSLDPEHDTPARLREYEERFNTGDDITLLTGNRNAIHSVLRAYNAVYPGSNKMNHQPLTFIRTVKSSPWIRLEGLVSGSNLAREVRTALKHTSRTNHTSLPSAAY